MDTLTAFVLYLMVFRLAIIGTGIMSVLLGYLLLVRRVFPRSKDSSFFASMALKRGLKLRRINSAEFSL